MIIAIFFKFPSLKKVITKTGIERVIIYLKLFFITPALKENIESIKI